MSKLAGLREQTYNGGPSVLCLRLLYQLGRVQYNSINIYVYHTTFPPISSLVYLSIVLNPADILASHRNLPGFLGTPFKSLLGRTGANLSVFWIIILAQFLYSKILQFCVFSRLLILFNGVDTEFKKKVFFMHKKIALPPEFILCTRLDDPVYHYDAI